MSRWWKPLLISLTLAAAFFVTFVWPRHNGLQFDIDASPRAQAARQRVPYDLSQVRVLKAVITKVNQNYVDPERIAHRTMLLAGLNAIQRTVAPVLVHYENGASHVTVQVDNKRREFQADDVNSPWAVTWRFQEIFSFLQKNLQHEADIKLREVEYAAVNGMLRTLDPHSLVLPPEEYSEMQLNTRGEFGGLGIVISIRDGKLTVIKPMPGTPAFRAGLERMDRIVKINDESTLNMPLEEAVDRLRGAPGSSVTVWVTREGPRGWKQPKRFDLVRAVIHIDSVESRMLKDRIGLVQVKSFQQNTCSDIRKALAELHEQKMRGLVLDLRDNPGGLLQQAVCVADTFLPSGTIVTTSSTDPQKRDRKLARSEGTEPFYPMIVLANGGSASASEIVAGALKNHDRALAVGQRTFGKGSVQVLYSDDNDGWALKLTIAQYLTPGDVSIQGVGIVPDIQIDPMTVDPLDMDLAVDKDYLREADLTAHLTHARAHETAKPLLVLRYYLPQEARQRLREARPDDLEENEKEDEFLTRFSRDLLDRASRPGRREMLRDTEPVIASARAKEMSRAQAELAELGVDWTVGPDQGPSTVQTEVSTSAPDNTATAGEPFLLKVEVTNTGDAPLYRLRALTRSDNELFDGRELVFGRLMPGKSRSWSTTLGVCRSEEEDGAGESPRSNKPKNPERKCVLPRHLPDRADGIRVEFEEAYEHAPDPAEVRTVIRALPRPRLAYTLHVADNGQGNGDGMVQRGELVKVYFKVKNAGKGKSYDTVANLRNLSGRGILLQDGRFHLGSLQPSEERMVEFTFEVLPHFDEPEAKLQVSITDTVLRESAGEKLVVPIRPEAESVQAADRTVHIKSGTQVRERPGGGRVIAQITGGGTVSLPAKAQLGEQTRVQLSDGRPGWVANDGLASAAEGQGRIQDAPSHMPPMLVVDHDDTLVTRDSKLHVRGAAHDDSRVRDLYIFVGARKVFYKSNREGSDPKRASFETDIPLRPGVNYVTVVAREDDDVVSRETFLVRRDAPDGSLMETPKRAEHVFWTQPQLAPH